MTILGVTASSITKLNTAFDSIATLNGTGSSGTITFSSIPSTYAHLQLRINAVAVAPAGVFNLRFNGDTASNYDWQVVENSTTTLLADGTFSSTFIRVGGFNNLLSTTEPCVAIIDINDYAVTNKNKNVRSLAGFPKTSGSVGIDIHGGIWRSTTAINSISVIQSSGNWATSTSVSLYGIKGS